MTTTEKQYQNDPLNFNLYLKTFHTCRLNISLPEMHNCTICTEDKIFTAKSSLVLKKTTAKNETRQKNDLEDEQIKLTQA